MLTDVSRVGYFIWGVDCAVYGPVELPTLVAWIKAERIIADTWVYLERTACWEKADRIPELQMFFHSRPAGASAPSVTEDAAAPAEALAPGALRHIKVLACLNDTQLERFLQLAEVRTVPAGTLLARQGEAADAMYILVEGELRLRAQFEGRETSLGNLNAGEFFGEICLFDHGPRLADVIAAQDSTLIKITAAEFERITNETPELAAPFLFALARMLACRIRAEARRYRDSLSFIRPAGGSMSPGHLQVPEPAHWPGSMESR